MLLRSLLRSLVIPAVLALAPSLVGCVDGTGSQSDDITDVQHTDVERQSIGNCWLYAEASWVESMHLQATGEKFDISQSYWTYWHWFKQITEEQPDQIETGGFFSIAGEIILERGLITESKFVKEDATSEMSGRQSVALAKMNQELQTGRLKDYASRSDRALVRKVMDEAWQLTSTVKGQMTKVFGKDYSKTFDNSSTITTKGTSVIAPRDFKVRYTERLTNPNQPTMKDTTLDVAIDEWVEANYPSYGGDSSKRNFQIRVQKALHDAQPVVITWDVDFNAMEGYDPVLQGSFNLTTLKNAGKPGRQGGHMTVLEDYEADTVEYGTLKAGVTLDPTNATDKKKLDAALLPSTKVKFFRIKNSWGALRDDRASAPGFPGYHDLYMDYLNGPIAWCPDAADPKSNASCTGKSTPFEAVVLPPGY
ncbi:MAG: hypothetical protein IPK82_11890 [Polyangiaceae bacterium]|nr:hypothetical protein [Polyangiaceae bacterium]